MAGERSSGTVVPAWLQGGGDSGALMRSIDWSRTPVGAVDTWPVSLETTVGMLLHSRHPMFLWWGPELVQFYNDAYLPSFGNGKHPRAMGQRGRECWPEIWSIISPQIEDVMQRGTPSWNEDHLVPIHRNGRIEEVYWTYGYSPVIAEQGQVGGTLVVCTETTTRVISSRRLHLLRTLSDQTAALSPDASVTAVLEGAGADIPFLALFAVDARSKGSALVEAVGLSREDAARHFGSDFARRLPMLADECQQHGDRPFAAAPIVAGPWPEPVSQIHVVRLNRAGERTNGFAVFGVSPRLPFDAAYRDLLDQVAAHIGLTLARADSLRGRMLIERERDNLLMQAPVAISIVTGPDHTYQLVNKAYRQMVGRDVSGKSYLSAFPEVAGTVLPRILDRVYQTGEPYVSDEQPTPIDRGDGVLEERFFRFNLEPIRDGDGQVYGMMTCALDVTHQVRARRALEKSGEERELLLKDLEHANRAKDEFLAMLGHELRNPLSPIVTALQLMKQRAGDEHARERNVIERQVRHLVRLVDDLLDVSKITRGKIELKREVVDIADVLAHAVEIASVLFEQRAHKLSIHVPRRELFWEGDAFRLAQAVANLLTNAARYTPVGGQVRLEARCDGGDIVIAVADNGNGISAELLPRIFDLFVQGRRDADRAEGGLGIGLSLARTLVSMHGGGITAESDGLGRGSSFVIRLPASLVAAPGQPAPSWQPPPAHVARAQNPQRLLIVDDNVDAAEALCEFLRDSGHEVRLANDPIEALELFDRMQPSFAILDIGLPVMDGYELADRLRKRAPSSGCRLVALTGYGQDHDRVRSQAAGFVGHLVKPVDLTELLRLIDRAA